MRRMTPLDASLLARDTATQPRQVASLAVLEQGDVPLDHERLVRLISERIDLVPRYRQVARPVPLLGTPVWVDDQHFDLSLHVRRSALPSPGGPEALLDLVGRLVARRLDPARPLWELYLVEGMTDGRVALLFKAHQALVDGSETIDLAQVLLEETPHERDLPDDTWSPHPAPTSAQLLARTVRRNVTHPAEGLGVAEFQLRKVLGRTPAVVPKQPPVGHALTASLGQSRRFATVSASLDDHRLVRDAHGGTVNDVVLAAIAGGLRGWMLTRGEALSSGTRVRALVPMSVDAEDGLPTTFGTKVRGHLLSLPVGEANPVVRLHQVSYALKGHRETGSAVAANRLAGLPGFATSTFHAVGARVGEAESGRGYQLLVTNVPGPQDPVYMAGQRLSEVYPALPLTGSRALAIGVTSYAGRVFYGLVGDRDAMRDLDVLAQCIDEALVELVEGVGSRSRAPRGRQRPRR